MYLIGFSVNLQRENSRRVAAREGARRIGIDPLAMKIVIGGGFMVGSALTALLFVSLDRWLMRLAFLT